MTYTQPALNIEKIQLFVNGECIKEFFPDETYQARQALYDASDRTKKPCFLKYVPVVTKH